MTDAVQPVADPAAPPPPGPSPVPRRVAAPRWLDLRLVLGVVLVLGSVILGARVVSAADHTYALVGADRDLAAGTTITGQDLREVRVSLPDHGRGTYLQTRRDAVGKTLSREVSAGELLTEDAVRPIVEHVTITVRLAQGAAPDLRSGQRITVWLTSRSCPSTVLLSDVTVQGVRRGQSGFSDSTGGQDVVLDLQPGLAQRVVAVLGADGVTLRAGVLSEHAPGPPAGDPQRCLAGSGG